MRGTRPGMTSSREKPHETIRPYREAARHQAREGMELETHLRTDRRLFGRGERRRHSRPDETDQTAGGECRRTVRTVKIGSSDAQRSADARRGHADAADRSPDL